MVQYNKRGDNMEYISVKEASKIWNISERRIRRLLLDGRINGAKKIGNSWSIPKDIQKPIDNRYKKQSNTILEFLNTNKNYFEDFITRCTYHSNAIEGNTLTYAETYALLFNDNDIMNYEAPNHMGIHLGKVIDVTPKKIKIKLEHDLSQFEGVRFKESDKGITINFL